MKILLEESLPRKLSNEFDAEHEVRTVRDMGWSGKRNGELLKLMTENDFELFVTVDRNLPYQQNLQKLLLTIVVLHTKDNTRETSRLLIPKLFNHLSKGNPQNVIKIS